MNDRAAPVPTWSRRTLLAVVTALIVGVPAVTFAQQSLTKGAVLDMYEDFTRTCQAKSGRPLSASQQRFFWTCVRSQMIGGSSYELAHLLSDDFNNPANYSLQSLQPPGIPNASGGGTNLGRGGNCLVGYQDAGPFTPYHAFRWTPATGPTDLGTLDPPGNASRMSFAYDVASDCSVAVGVSETVGGSTQHAFRWAAAGGMADLGAPAGAGRLSSAFGVSADGAMVVGDAEFVDGAAFTGFRKGAYRWNGGSFQALGALVAGFPSVATAIAGDGSVVVGSATTASGSSAFRWTATAGMVSIGNLSGFPHALATGVSDNGKVVVGNVGPIAMNYRGAGGFDAGTGAFRWTATDGMKDLRQLLIDTGVNMSGIAIVKVSGISPDGQYIAGNATTPTSGPNSPVAFVLRYCDDAVDACSATAASAPVATLSSTSSNAGNVTRGVTQAVAAITLTNSGNANLTLSALGITGTDASQFTVAHNCGSLPATLAPGASCVLTPSFAPASAGAKTASLVLTTNASGTQPQVALAGTGADFSLSATNVTASVAAGQSATVPLSLATSGAALTSAVTFTATGSPQGVTVSFSPATLAAGSTSGGTTVTITTTSRVLAAAVGPTDLFHATAVLPALLMLLTVAGTRLRRRQLATAVVLIAVGMLGACGGGGGSSGSGASGGGSSSSVPAVNPNGTPAGTYTITVTATGGTAARSMTLALTVS